MDVPSIMSSLSISDMKSSILFLAMWANTTLRNLINNSLEQHPIMQILKGMLIKCSTQQKILTQPLTAALIQSGYKYCSIATALEGIIKTANNSYKGIAINSKLLIEITSESSKSCQIIINTDASMLSALQYIEELSHIQDNRFSILNCIEKPDCKYCTNSTPDTFFVQINSPMLKYAGKLVLLLSIPINLTSASIFGNAASDLYSLKSIITTESYLSSIYFEHCSKWYHYVQNTCTQIGKSKQLFQHIILNDALPVVAIYEKSQVPQEAISEEDIKIIVEYCEVRLSIYNLLKENPVQNNEEIPPQSVPSAPIEQLPAEEIKEAKNVNKESKVENEEYYCAECSRSITYPEEIENLLCTECMASSINGESQRENIKQKFQQQPVQNYLTEPIIPQNPIMPSNKSGWSCSQCHQINTTNKYYCRCNTINSLQNEA